MLKFIFCILILYCIVFSQASAGLIDSLAVVNNKNATIAESLPKKKIETSKYNGLKNKNKQHLETAVDAHQPVNYKLQAAAQQPKIDESKLSEQQLEAIGDAVMAEKLAENIKTTTKPKAAIKPKATTKKEFNFDKCDEILPLV